MTTIYDDLLSSTGLSTIESFYANQTAAPVEGKALLASILFANNDNKIEELGLMVTTSIPVPGTVVSIPEVGQAQKAVSGVLVAYLLSFMTNFTLGGFDGMAKVGKLI